MKVQYYSPLSLRIALLLAPLIFFSCKQKEDKIDGYKEFIPVSTDSASLRKNYSEIDDLVKSGKYNEALARHIWFHNHILEYDSSWGGVRLSFALADWQKLGDKFKPAKDSLYKIRDLKTERIMQHGSSEQDFNDVMAINRAMFEDEKTITMFELISEKYPQLANSSLMSSYRTFLDAKRYDLLQKYNVEPLVLYKREKKLHMAIDSSLDLRSGDKIKMVTQEYDQAFSFQEMFVTNVKKLINYSKAIKDESGALYMQKDALAIVSYDKLKDVLKGSY